MPQTMYPSSPRRRGSSCYLVCAAVNWIPASAGMTVFRTLRQVSSQAKTLKNQRAAWFLGSDRNFAAQHPQGAPKAWRIWALTSKMPDPASEPAPGSIPNAVWQGQAAQRQADQGSRLSERSEFKRDPACREQRRESRSDPDFGSLFLCLLSFGEAKEGKSPAAATERHRNSAQSEVVDSTQGFDTLSPNGKSRHKTKVPLPMLIAKNINQYYGGSHILRDVSLQANLGKITVLLGRNGVGKTTLLKSLMGLIPIKTGSIEFDGKAIHSATPYERARSGIGFVPQGREIFARLTVEENLRMGLASKSASTPIPPELYELFPVLKQMLNRRGGDLSGGQQQQLSIARALAAKPKLLILDEPTEGIQPSIIKDIGRVIRMLADRGDMAIVLVEQYYDFAAELADDYLVMERGEFIARGAGKDMEANRVRQLVAI